MVGAFHVHELYDFSMLNLTSFFFSHKTLECHHQNPLPEAELTRVYPKRNKENINFATSPLRVTSSFSFAPAKMAKFAFSVLNLKEKKRQIRNHVNFFNHFNTTARRKPDKKRSIIFRTHILPRCSKYNQNMIHYHILQTPMEHLFLTASA